MERRGEGFLNLIHIAPSFSVRPHYSGLRRHSATISPPCCKMTKKIKVKKRNRFVPLSNKLDFNYEHVSLHNNYYTKAFLLNNKCTLDHTNNNRKCVGILCNVTVVR